MVRGAMTCRILVVTNCDAPWGALLSVDDGCSRSWRVPHSAFDRPDDSKSQFGPPSYSLRDIGRPRVPGRADCGYGPPNQTVL